MTGLLLGIPSMALSEAFSDRNAVRWDTARAVAPKVIMQFAKGTWSQGSILNINFPDVPVGEVGPIELTTQGVGLMDDVEVISAIDPRSLEYHWLRLRRAARRDAIGDLRHWTRAGIGHSPTVRADEPEHSSWLDRMMCGNDHRRRFKSSLH